MNDKLQDVWAEQIQKLQAENDELRSVHSEMQSLLYSITGARKCSMGSIGSHYDVRIGVGRVDRLSANLRAIQ